MCGRACGALSGCGCNQSLTGLGEAPASQGGFPFVLAAVLGAALVFGLTFAAAK